MRVGYIFKLWSASALTLMTGLLSMSGGEVIVDCGLDSVGSVFMFFYYLNLLIPHNFWLDK